MTNDSGFITDASLANYLEKDTFKEINWNSINSNDNTITYKLKITKDATNNEHKLKLTQYNSDEIKRDIDITSNVIIISDKTDGSDYTYLSAGDILITHNGIGVSIFPTYMHFGNTNKKLYYKDIATVSQIPTTTGELTNDSGFITNAALTGYATEDWVNQKGYLTSVAWGDITGKPTLSTVATSGSYNDLIDKPTIPTATSQLDNDSNFITNAALTGYATTSDVSTAISSQTKETWTFTLSDGSTVTKSIVLGE